MSNDTSSTACTRATSRWKMIPRVIGKYFVRFSTQDERFSPPTGAPAGSSGTWHAHDGHLQTARFALLPEPALVLRAQVAGLGVAAAAILELGPLLVARLEAMRAARMERAAGRHVDQRGRRALDRPGAASPSA